MLIDTKGIDENGKEFDLKLTKKQLDFVNEYVQHYNGTQAALKAGYSKKTATSIAHENLIKPDVQAYLRYLNKKMNGVIGYKDIAQKMAEALDFNPLELFETKTVIRQGEHGNYEQDCVEIKNIDDIKQHGKFIDSVEFTRDKSRIVAIKKTEAAKIILEALDKFNAYIERKEAEKEGAGGGIEGLSVSIRKSDGSSVSLDANGLSGANTDSQDADDEQSEENQ